MTKPAQGQSRHGPLPGLLLGLTFMTGLIDAVSFFRFDHVFVANMTGNVVFLGFALTDPHYFSIPASSLALIGFIAGALGGGRLGTVLWAAPRPLSRGGAGGQRGHLRR